MEVDALDALLGLHPDERRAGGRQGQLALFHGAQVDAADLEAGLRQIERAMAVAEGRGEDALAIVRGALGRQGAFDLAEGPHAHHRVRGGGGQKRPRQNEQPGATVR